MVPLMSKKVMPGTSLNVQWLRLSLSLRCVCLIPGLGTKILHAVAQKKKKKEAMPGSLSAGARHTCAHRTLRQNHGPPGRIHGQHSCHELRAWMVREHPPWDQRWENGILRGGWCHILFVNKSLTKGFSPLHSKFLLGCQPSGGTWVGG